MARTFHTFDLIIAGAGPAGIAALREALRHTSNVILIDNIPHMRYWAEDVTDTFMTAAREGSVAQALAAVRHKVADEELKREHTLKGIDHYRKVGDMTLETPYSVRVDGRLIHCKAIILAAPSQDMTMELPETLTASRLLTAENLAQKRSLPPQICLFPGAHPRVEEMQKTLEHLGIQSIPQMQWQNEKKAALWILPGIKPDLQPFRLAKLKIPLTAEGMPHLQRGNKGQIKGLPIYVAENHAEAGRKLACQALTTSDLIFT